MLTLKSKIHQHKGYLLQLDLKKKKQKQKCRLEETWLPQTLTTSTCPSPQKEMENRYTELSENISILTKRLESSLCL